MESQAFSDLDIEPLVNGMFIYYSAGTYFVLDESTNTLIPVYEYRPAEEAKLAA